MTLVVDHAFTAALTKHNNNLFGWVFSMDIENRRSHRTIYKAKNSGTLQVIYSMSKHLFAEEALNETSPHFKKKLGPWVDYLDREPVDMIMMEGSHFKVTKKIRWADFVTVLLNYFKNTTWKGKFIWRTLVGYQRCAETPLLKYEDTKTKSAFDKYMLSHARHQFDIMDTAAIA